MIGTSFGISTLALHASHGTITPPTVTVFNFTAGTLPAGVSLSRASAATYFNASGVLATAAAHSARFDHDPQTLEPKGLLVEGGTTNLIAQSSDLSTSAWVKNAFTPSQNSDVAPDGSAVGGWDFGSGYAFCGMSTTSGVPHTASFWVKANQNCTIGLRACGTSGSDTEDVALTTSWTRISRTATPASDAPKFLLENRSGQGFGVTGLEVFIWGVQVELGTVPSSYVATSGSPVSRASDTAGISGVNGVFDVLVHYANGTSATLQDQAVSDGWWPAQSSAWVTSIELHPQGTL